MMLRVQFKAEPANEIELRFEKINVAFLVRHQLLEQVACYIVLRGVAVRRGFLVERAGGNLRRQVAVQHLFDVLTDTQGIEQCRFGKPSRKMIRTTSLSACSISSIDSLRHCLARSL